MLGTIDRAQVVRLAELLAAQDAAALLTYAQSLDEWSPDYAQLLDGLAALLARVALMQAVPQYGGDELHPPAELRRLAAALPAEDVQLYYQTAILGGRDLPLAPDAASGFQMTLLRMIAFRPGGAAREPAATAAGTAGATNPVPAARADSAIEWTAEHWSAILAQLEVSGVARQLASHCALLRKDGHVLHLRLEQRNQHMRTRAQEDKLTAALSRFAGEPLRIEIELASEALESPAAASERQAGVELETARKSLETDPLVRALQDRFGAVLQPDTVRPHKRD